MENAYEISFHEDVLKKDVPKIGREVARYILKLIDEKLSKNPEVFGKPLRYSLKNYRTLRTGDYRVIFKIDSSKVKVLAIGNRKDIYNEILKRIMR